MDACHLLLGRPWQYDHRATHDGRSNTYSFWDAGRRCILRPMFANAIKDDIFSVQKRVSKDTTKPRTASFQGGGDDVAASARDNLRNVLKLVLLALKFHQLNRRRMKLSPPSKLHVLHKLLQGMCRSIDTRGSSRLI